MIDCSVMLLLLLHPFRLIYSSFIGLLPEQRGCIRLREKNIYFNSVYLKIHTSSVYEYVRNGTLISMVCNVQL